MTDKELCDELYIYAGYVNKKYNQGQFSAIETAVELVMIKAAERIKLLNVEKDAISARAANQERTLSKRIYDLTNVISNFRR